MTGSGSAWTRAAASLTPRAVLVWVVLIQIAGAAAAAYGGEISVESWMLYQVGLRDPWLVVAADAMVLSCLAAALAGVVGHRAGWFWVALYFGIDAVVGMTVEVGAFMELTLPAHAVRIAAPLALALASDSDDEKPTGGGLRPVGIRFLMVAAGLTFAAHGVEALAAHPRFVDYLIVFTHDGLGLEIAQSQLEIALQVVGVIDLAVALPALLLRRWSSVYAYMAIWGTIAAASRVVHGGMNGLPEMLIRSANGGVAAAIVLFLMVYDRRDDA